MNDGMTQTIQAGTTGIDLAVDVFECDSAGNERYDLVTGLPVPFDISSGVQFKLAVQSPTGAVSVYAAMAVPGAGTVLNRIQISSEMADMFPTPGFYSYQGIVRWTDGTVGKTRLLQVEVEPALG
jgi:hypothetical protein